MDSKGLVVYSAIFGEGFSPPKVKDAQGARFLLFSDIPRNNPEPWETIVVDPPVLGDSVRSSKDFKIRPHKWLPEFSTSIWIDASVELVTAPGKLAQGLGLEDPEVLFGCFNHDFCPTNFDEFNLILERGLDAPRAVLALRQAILSSDPEVGGKTPIWGGIIGRRHMDERIVSAMDRWYAAVLAYSRRDQLSLPWAIRELPQTSVRFLGSHPNRSEYHRWPKPGYQKPVRLSASILKESGDSQESLYEEITSLQKEVLSSAAQIRRLESSLSLRTLRRLAALLGPFRSRGAKRQNSGEKA